MKRGSSSPCARGAATRSLAPQIGTMERATLALLCADSENASGEARRRPRFCAVSASSSLTPPAWRTLLLCGSRFFFAAFLPSLPMPTVCAQYIKASLTAVWRRQMRPSWTDRCYLCAEYVHHTTERPHSQHHGQRRPAELQNRCGAAESERSCAALTDSARPSCGYKGDTLSTALAEHPQSPADKSA